uniref:polysaccharide biosynthesis protein n=1 Tax=Thaumasiovibrio occultus TaxID=1891184 RepID=UPI000B35F390|nr:nucleoside-diphosphate sugar epimerase/dehydratase [Thaumasiovibrio occultus]
MYFAFWMAFWTRLGDTTFVDDPGYTKAILITLIATLAMFARIGLYRAILRYMNLHALMTVCVSAALSAIFVIFASYFTHAAVPRSVPIIYGAYLIILCGGVRLVARLLINRHGSSKKPNVIIFGAGSAGRQLANVLLQGKYYHPVAFVDDNRKLHKSSIQGMTVYRRKYLDKIVKKYRVEKVLLAMPSAARSRRKEVVDFLALTGLEVLTIPNMSDIVNGNAKIDSLRDVPIEDLLGRDAVAPDQALLEANIRGKAVMVTGAGGSIGSELCRQIIKLSPKKLVLFERSEFALYQIDQELNRYLQLNELAVEICPILGSVQDSGVVLSALKAFDVQTVYHAAAYKHVPLVEYNVVAGVRNNVFGTLVTAKAALQAGVESFVLISTDKAVRPTNVMGATKRVAEMALQAMASENPSTRFCMVRFGNVLGSSGSVIPLFKKQIAGGGPVTVTHPDIIRYFMTIPEAAQLVIQAGAMGQGGDVFVLDMGEPVRIADLARNLIHLSGLEVRDVDNPLGDIEIHYSGLRPGEKLYEELLIGDNVSETRHPRILTANEVALTADEFGQMINVLDAACRQSDISQVRDILQSYRTGFAPSSEISDLIWINDKQ